MTKARFEELEKRCSKLKKVRILRFSFTIALFFLVGFGGYYWMHHNDIKSVVVVETAPIKIQQPPQIQPKVIAMPSLSDQNESNMTLIKMTPSVIKEVSPDETLFLAPHVYKDTAKLPVLETEEATRSLKEEHLLLQHYKEVPNFDNAYALSEFYFGRKAYTEVIMWAKEASKYNTSSEKPWILYAKAKFYSGDRTEAIRSLELFLSYINSNEIQELLNFYKGQE